MEVPICRHIINFFGIAGSLIINVLKNYSYEWASDLKHQYALWRLIDPARGNGGLSNENIKKLALECQCMVIYDEHRKIVAYIGFSHYNALCKNIEISVWSKNNYWYFNAHILYAIFSYAFKHVGCLTVRTYVKKTKKKRQNKLNRIYALNRRMGFQYEGVAVGVLPYAKDAWAFSMRKKDCQWLNSVEEESTPPSYTPS